MRKEEGMKQSLVRFTRVVFMGLVLAGCSQTYPGDRVKESIQEICHKEYGIDNIQIKIDGRTIGVYLPIKKLFAADLKEALTRKQGAEIENLFQPAPEALDQVEDVLFSISRVLLSTDLKLQFYVLQATDVEKTGLQLVLSGYVEDIKRVRLWDISRDEYRKRILHELRLNRAVVWHRPVRSFFRVLEQSPSLKSVKPYFVAPLSPELFRSLFFFNPELLQDKPAQWRLGELRSTPLEAAQVLVYAPVTIGYDPIKVAPGSFKIAPGSSIEYLFVVSLASEPPKISRVIPLSYLDETGKVQKIQIPGDLDIHKDLDSWESEFPLTEIHLGDFLAEQLSRRTQNLVFSDERIQNTFEAVHIGFKYQKEESKDEKKENKAKNYFSLELDVKPKTPVDVVLPPSALDEDVLYLLNLASREFVDVLRSYQFSDYDFLQLNLSTDPSAHILGREDLELFRRNKADLAGLLGGISPF